MRNVAGIIGVLLTLGGAIWFLQGIGLLPGSFMTGDEFWAVAGFLAVILGLALIRYWREKPDLRGSSNPPDPDDP